MPLMKSLRDIRLSNTSGHCILVKAEVPVTIPNGLLAEALAAGLVETEGSKPTTATEPTVSAEEQAAIDAAAAQEAADQRTADLDAAILIVLTRKDEDDFKKDGTPKATKIVAELDPAFEPRPTATEISEAYERLQENFDLAED